MKSFTVGVLSVSTIGVLSVSAVVLIESLLESQRERFDEGLPLSLSLARSLAPVESSRERFDEAVSDDCSVAGQQSGAGDWRARSGVASYQRDPRHRRPGSESDSGQATAAICFVSWLGGHNSVRCVSTNALYHIIFNYCWTPQFSGPLAVRTNS